VRFPRTWGEIYGAKVSKQAISTITDRVVEGMSAWGEPAAGSGASGDVPRLRECGRSGDGNVAKGAGLGHAGGHGQGTPRHPETCGPGEHGDGKGAKD
jgi:hypothetical protein